MGRIFILYLHLNLANDMWNLWYLNIYVVFKGLLHILMNPTLFYFFSFSFHIASSCNITSV